MVFDSWDGLDYCISAHDEQNCIANAARLGVSTLGTDLYLNDQVPCGKICLPMLINAGVKTVTVTQLECYDDLGPYLINYSKIEVRDFNGKVWS